MKTHMTVLPKCRRTPAGRLLWACVCLPLFGCVLLDPARGRAEEPVIASQAAENRVALVIGQSDYSAFPLPSAAADAAVIANNLEEAGFAVESGVDLPEYGIGEKVSEFINKINLSGVNTTGVIYISGRFAQINGENLLLPVSTRIDRASDAALYGFNIEKLLTALAAVPMKSCIVIIDASAPPESIVSEKTFAPGLAIVEPPKGFLISYSQNPGMKLVDPSSGTGHFAKAFLEALQQQTNNFPDFFKIIRVRIYDETVGAQRTWESDRLTNKSFSFFARDTDAPAPAPILDLSDNDSQVASLPREEAYKKVIALDTIQSYQSFIVAFPEDQAVPNIQYNLAVRREAEVWAHVLRLDTADAYWTYIQSYPDGGNVNVARARLARLGQADVDPAAFTPVGFDDIPPPLASGEIIASSASMPVEFLPRPPAMQLPVVPAAVMGAIAAAIALPAMHGQGPRSVPTMRSVSVHPAWAGPVAPSFNSPAIRQPWAPAVGVPAAGLLARPSSVSQPVSPPFPVTAGVGTQRLSPQVGGEGGRSLAPVTAQAVHANAASVPLSAAAPLKPISPIATPPRPVSPLFPAAAGPGTQRLSPQVGGEGVRSLAPVTAQAVHANAASVPLSAAAPLKPITPIATPPRPLAGAPGGVAAAPQVSLHPMNDNPGANSAGGTGIRAAPVASPSHQAVASPQQPRFSPPPTPVAAPARAAAPQNTPQKKCAPGAKTC